MPAWAHFAHLSEVDLTAPEPSRFPLLADVVGTELTLRPGEILFIPAFWWHQVTAVDVSISINIFWRATPTQHFVPNWLRGLPSKYDRDRLAAFDVAVLIQLAREAKKANLRWVQALCSSGALHQYLRTALRRTGIDERDAPNRLEALHRLLTTKLAPAVPILDRQLIDRWTKLASLARERDDQKLSAHEIDLMAVRIEGIVEAHAQAK
jgi:hypothetical protein